MLIEGNWWTSERHQVYFAGVGKIVRRCSSPSSVLHQRSMFRFFFLGEYPPKINRRESKVSLSLSLPLGRKSSLSRDLVFSFHRHVPKRHRAMSFLLLLVLAATASARQAPTVRTNFGIVRGKWLTNDSGRSIAAFLGIPYAEPPVGELRFESPRPWKDDWKGERDATEDGSMCVQLGRDGTTRGTEDCLNLNVFVPLILPRRIYPVMVFVHGGGFNRGSNNSTNFAPDYLADCEVILVTVNYRVNIFGFLSTATEQVPGNAGLKDIREALRWVQNNIEHFGGDPNMTTLFGQSSGAGATHHLALSESTEGLFDKFITQSGSALAPWATHPPFLMRMKYLMIARELGCTEDYDEANFATYLLKGYKRGDGTDEAAYARALEEDEEILSCLRELSPVRLVNSVNLLYKWNMNPWTNFGPTVEIHSEDAVITKHPYFTIVQGEFRDIPWISGVVKDEGLLKSKELFLNRDLMQEFIERYTELGVYFLESAEVVRNTSFFYDALAAFYFPNGIKGVPSYLIDANITQRDGKIIKVSFQLTGDALINWSSYLAMTLQASLMNSSAFFYHFGYEGTFTSTYVEGVPSRYGVAHSDDLNYLFPVLNNKFADLQLHNTGNDRTMIHIMTELWTSFARDGVPKARQIPTWETFYPNASYANIGSKRSPEITIEQDFEPARMRFWAELTEIVSFPLEEMYFEEEDEDAPGQLENDGSTASLSVVPSSQKLLFFVIALQMFLVF